MSYTRAEQVDQVIVIGPLSLPTAAVAEPTVEDESSAGSEPSDAEIALARGTELATPDGSEAGGAGSGAGHGTVGVGDGTAGSGDRSLGASPPAAVPGPRCGDPINGEWVALIYSAYYHDWYRFTLHIERTGAELRGEILVRFWSGGTADHAPPACRAGAFDTSVRMSAHGRIEGDRVNFGAASFEVVQVACGSRRGYNPDRFTGTLITEEDRLYTVHNDGHRAANEHVRFWRARCWDHAE